MTGRIRASFRLGCVAVVALGTLVASAGTGHADSPSPSPTATPTPTAAPSPTAPRTGSPSDTASPSAPPAKTSPAPTSPPPSVSAERQQRRAEAPGLSLSVGSRFGVGSAYWSDIGAFAFRGSAAGFADGSVVEIYRRVDRGSWTRLASGRTAKAAFAVDVPVQQHGTFGFAATIGGPPGQAGAAASNSVTVTVGDSRVVFDRPVERIDTLKDPRLSGSVVPARSGVTVHIDRQLGGKWLKVASARTNTSGRFALDLGFGRGHVSGYRLRAAYRTPNRAFWETSTSHRVERVAVLDAVVTATTAAEVARTYRAGCPVGRSRLSTITMNFYGSDKKVHRGVLIMRKDLTGEVKKAFGRALDARFPITRMNNPNAYGGNDPEQMRADNTSGFNCRSVVGNPYRRSPHSYGTAIDINPRQNPYRDVTGKWWPENGRGYIDRTPRRGGMLSSGSTLVKTLRSEGFFWGGLWSPGKDYQHFQY